MKSKLSDAKIQLFFDIHKFYLQISFFFFIFASENKRGRYETSDDNDSRSGVDDRYAGRGRDGGKRHDQRRALPRVCAG